jgi:hypothetical protein
MIPTASPLSPRAIATFCALDVSAQVAVLHTLASFARERPSRFMVTQEQREEARAGRECLRAFNAEFNAEEAARERRKKLERRIEG